MSKRAIEQFLIGCGVASPFQLSVSGPGRTGDVVVLQRPFAMVGRDQCSCVRLEDLHISHRHMYLQAVAGRLFGIDVSSGNGIRWDGERRTHGWLVTENPVHIGPFSLGLSAPTALMVPSLSGAAGTDWDPLHERISDPRLLRPTTVEVLGSGTNWLQWRMNRLMALVGTSRHCRVRFRDPEVSRFHCSLVGTSSRIWVVDLLSRTGTWLNGRRVRCAPLAAGDELSVGRYRLRLQYDGSEPHAAKPRAAQPAITLPAAVPPGAMEPKVVTLSSPLELQLAQQMSDQFRRLLLDMVQMMASMQANQAVMVEKELEQIRRVSCQLYTLQQQPQLPAPVVPAPQQIDAAVHRSAEAPATDPGTSTNHQEGMVERKKTRRVPEAGRQKTSTKVVKDDASQDGAGSEDARRSKVVPKEHFDEDVHAWLTQQITALEQPGENRWQKLLSYLRGK